MPPGTGFPLRCLLRLVGLRWGYSNPPPHVPTHTDRSGLNLRVRNRSFLQFVGKQRELMRDTDAPFASNVRSNGPWQGCTTTGQYSDCSCKRSPKSSGQVSLTGRKTALSPSAGRICPTSYCSREVTHAVSLDKGTGITTTAAWNLITRRGKRAGTSEFQAVAEPFWRKAAICFVLPYSTNRQCFKAMGKIA
jgi:hypothetical protein